MTVVTFELDQDAGFKWVGTWDPVSGAFPTISSTGAGSCYYITASGSLDSVSFSAGEVLVARIDSPSTTTFIGNWTKIGLGRTAAELLTAIKTVDGTGSGLDADTLDGQHGSFFSALIAINADNITTNADDITANWIDTNANTSKLAGIEVGATADQTGAEIKAAYEAEADTNAYNDAAVSKLAGIEAGAQVNTSIIKGITVESPTTSEDITIFFTPVAITVTELVGVCIGSSPSVTYTLHHSTDRSAAGNKVVTVGNTVTSTTTGDSVISFDDATIPTDSFIWLETSATSGTVDSIHISIEYTVD